MYNGKFEILKKSLVQGLDRWLSPVSQGPKIHPSTHTRQFLTLTPALGVSGALLWLLAACAHMCTYPYTDSCAYI